MDDRYEDCKDDGHEEKRWDPWVLGTILMLIVVGAFAVWHLNHRAAEPESAKATPVNIDGALKHFT